MSGINRIENIASIEYDGDTIYSMPVRTVIVFEPTINKSVDKFIATVGETLTYTVKVTNPASQEIYDVSFADSIPYGSTYVKGSFKVNGVAEKPTIEGSMLKYTIRSLSALDAKTITFQVIVGEGWVREESRTREESRARVESIVREESRRRRS